MGKLCLLDFKTVFASNLSKIANECNIDINLLSANVVKKTMSYFICPENEIWRIPLLRNLIDVKTNQFVLDEFNDDDIDELIINVCTT